MDDYIKEITDLQTEVNRLIADEADPQEIADLELQIRVLTALYDRATTLFEQGRADPGLTRRLAMRGYGEWTLDNVYAFVFETAVELPDTEPRAFLSDITRTDFAGLLEAAAS